MTNEQTTACRVCNFKLWKTESPTGEITWQHIPVPDDGHNPEPFETTDAQIDLRCDFCNQVLSIPIWTYPCEDFIMLILGEHVGYEQRISVGDWGVCNICHEMIQTVKFNQLISRSLNCHGVRMDDPSFKAVRAALSRNFYAFQRKRTGDPYLDYLNDPQEEAPST